jgi:hypothetical protein
MAQSRLCAHLALSLLGLAASVMELTRRLSPEEWRQKKLATFADVLYPIKQLGKPLKENILEKYLHVIMLRFNKGFQLSQVLFLVSYRDGDFGKASKGDVKKSNDTDKTPDDNSNAKEHCHVGFITQTLKTKQEGYDT